MRLAPELFENTLGTNNPFGLGRGQMGGGLHNAGWYSIRGIFLTWGDLSREHVQRISAEIDPKEAFIVLKEWDWRYLGDDLKTKGIDYKKPGLDFLMKRAVSVIRQNQIIRVIHHRDHGMGLVEDDLPWGLNHTALIERSVRKMLGVPQSEDLVAA